MQNNPFYVSSNTIINTPVEHPTNEGYSSLAPRYETVRSIRQSSTDHTTIQDTPTLQDNSGNRQESEDQDYASLQR